MRRHVFPIALGLRRLRQGSVGTLAALAGVAAAAAFLAVVVAGTGVAQDRSVGRAVDDVPASARAVRAVWFGIPATRDEQWSALNAVARTALARAGLGSPTAIVLVRESTVAGRFVGIAGVDSLREHVLLRTGRLPSRCTPERCEVLRLRGRGRLPDAPGLRLVEVGTATLVSRQLFGDFLQPTDNALADATVAPALARSASYHRPEPGPLVVAEGVATLAASPVLARTYRSYAWVLPLRSGTPRVWEVEPLLRNLEGVRAELRTRGSGWELAAPAAELADARSAAIVSGRRLLLVGGQAAALLVAFALLAAGTLRRDHAAARRRLVWNGASAGQLRTLSAAEGLPLGTGGALLGWIAGVLAAALVARGASVPVAPLLRETVVSTTGLLLGLGLAGVAGVAIWTTVSVESEGPRRGVLELAAVGALVVLGAGLLGGTVDVERLRGSSGSAALLLVLPGLVGFVGAVVAVRVLPALGAACARTWRRNPLAVLTGSGLRRGAQTFAAAFLSLAIGLAVFAAAYRATLARSEADQTAFRVPSDILVQEDLATLVPVTEVATPARVAALVGSGHAFDVLRIMSSAGGPQPIGGVTLLGLPPSAIAQLPRWRDSWGADRATLAADIRPGVDTTPRGAALGAADTLAVELGPTLIGLRATIRGPAGDYGTVELGSGRGRSATLLAARLPARLRGGMLVALDLVPPPRLIEGGANAGIGYRGSIELRVRGVRLDGWIGEEGVTPRARGGELRLDFVLTPQRRSRLRARQAVDDELPRVAATPELVAQVGGIGRPLTLSVGAQRLTVRVVRRIERFPTAAGGAVVGDLAALRSAVDTTAPGVGLPNELWLDVVSGDESRVLAALDRPPFEPLAVTSRSQLLAAARSDPLGRGTLFALLAGTVVALLLGLVGVVLVVRAALRDEEGELLDLESQGASPRFLLRIVRTRVLTIVVVGVAVGIVSGAALTGLVGRVVTVTSGAQVAEPPLVVAVDPPILLATLLTFVALATLVAVVVSKPPSLGGER